VRGGYISGEEEAEGERRKAYSGLSEEGRTYMSISEVEGG